MPPVSEGQLCDSSEDCEGDLICGDPEHKFFQSWNVGVCYAAE